MQTNKEGKTSKLTKQNESEREKMDKDDEEEKIRKTQSSGIDSTMCECFYHRTQVVCLYNMYIEISNRLNSRVYKYSLVWFFVVFVLEKLNKLQIFISL